MKIRSSATLVPLLFLTLALGFSVARAADTKPPTCQITGAYTQPKPGDPSTEIFTFFVKASDDVGIKTLRYRAMVNGGPLGQWANYPYAPDQGIPFTVQCNFFHIEFESVDTSNNVSAAAVREFRAPFPNNPPPNPAPKFLAPKQLSTGVTSPRGVIARDMDGDGRADLVYVDNASESVTVRLNKGAGVFDTASIPFAATTTEKPDSIAVGNVLPHTAGAANDAFPDLVVASSANIHILTNTGDGAPGVVSFAESPTVLTDPDAYLSYVKVADVNGDGFDDIIAAGSKYYVGGGRLSIFFSDGAGGFSPPLTFDLGSTTKGLAVGDLDGDGKPDIVVIGSDTSNRPLAGVYLNQNGTFGTPAQFSLAHYPRGVALADLTGDHKPEICFSEVGVFGNSDGTAKTVLFFEFLANLGDGTFDNGQAYSATAQDFPQPKFVETEIALADVTADGKVDAILGDPLFGGATIMRFTPEFTTEGTFDFLKLDSVTPVKTAPGARYVAVADLNSDGRPDVVTANESANNLTLLFNAKGPVTQNGPVLGVQATAVPDGGKVARNDYIRYTMSYSNNGLAAAHNVVVKSEIPSNATYADTNSPSGSTLVMKNGVVTAIQWAVGTVNPGTTNSDLNFRVTVDPGAGVNKKIAGDVSITSDEGSHDDGPLPPYTVLNPLTLLTSVAPLSNPQGTDTHGGDSITYKISYTNAGAGAIQGAELTTSLPKNTTLAFDSNNNLDDSNAVPHIRSGVLSLSWPLGNLAANDSGFRTFRVIVNRNAPLSDDLTATATLTSKQTPKETTPFPNVTVRNPLHAELSSSSDLSAVSPGQTLTLQFTCKNASSLAMNNVRLEENIPGGTHFLSASNGGALDNVGRLVWPLGTLQPGQQVVLSFQVTVDWDTEVGKTIYNGNPDGNNVVDLSGLPTAKGFDLTVQQRGFYITADDPTTPANDPKKPDFLASGSQTFSFKIAQPPLNPPVLDFGQSATADSELRHDFFGDIATVVMPAAPQDGLNGEVTLHFVYRNVGGSTARKVKLNGFIPAGASFVANPGQLPNIYVGEDDAPQMVPSGTFATIGTNIFTLQIGDLAAGAAGRFSIKVKVQAGRFTAFPGQQVLGYLTANGSYLLSDSFRKLAEPAPDTLTVGVVPPVTWFLENRLSKPEINFAKAGEDGSEDFVIDHQNMGGVTASNVVLGLPLPPGVTYVSHEFKTFDHTASAPTTGALVDPAAKVLKFNMTPMASGEARSLVVHTRVDKTGKYPKGLALSEMAIQGRYVPPHVTTSARLAAASTDAASPTAKFIDGPSVLLATPARLWIGKRAPASKHPGDVISYEILFGNSGDFDATGVKIGIQVPSGTTLSGKPASSISNGLLMTPSSSTPTVLPKNWTYDAGTKIATWTLDKLPAHSSGAYKFLVRVSPKFTDCSVLDNSCYIAAAGNIPSRVPGPISTHIRSSNFFVSLWENVGCFFAGFGSNLDTLRKNAQANNDINSLEENSTVSTFGGTDLAFVRASAGTKSIAVIPNGQGQVVLLGGANSVISNDGGSLASHVISNDGGTIISQDGNSIVAAGAGHLLQIPDIDGSQGGTLTAAAFLANVDSVVTAGGGNVIGARGFNIISQDGNSVISNDGGSLRPIALHSANIVTAGGGNIVAAGAGNIFATGGGSLVGKAGGTLTGNAYGRGFNIGGDSIIAASAGGVVSNDGGSVVSNDGGSIISDNSEGVINGTGAGFFGK